MTENMSIRDMAPIYRPEDVENYKRVTREEAKAGKLCRVYCDGIFDLFHAGHSRVLKQAKNAFPNTILIVGVCDDESTQKYKGPTVTKEYERYEAVRNCRYVDYILPAASWGPYDQKFMDDNKFDFFAHDDLPSPRGEGIDPSDPNACIFTQLKRLGYFFATERTVGISTSDLIDRILRQHDLFTKRNNGRNFVADMTAEKKVVSQYQ